MMGVQPQEPDCSEFVEVDPTGRYGRYNEILGKGASKTVYRAFDEYEGIEVAWNQVKLYDFLQSPDDLERLYCEIHLLKTLKHKNIMKFYTSWVDTSKRNINFVTEMFTSGTLRQYRQKHKRVNIRAVKHWCRQILEGLLYLHSHDTPVIHRDLKCDNIFINGNQGVVKIGDLGLAAILRKSHAAHCVGTPEFMAPEVYEEEYNELVDIYSFGMCVLEMVTFEYPYSECTHPAQIYKKVISGTMPEALYRVKEPEVRQFVEKCLVSASRRLSARELLKDPFLHIDNISPALGGEVGMMGHMLRQPSIDPFRGNGSLIANGFSNGFEDETEMENEWDYESVADISMHGMDLFNGQEDEPLTNVDITIKGRRKEDGGIFLRLRITDKDGRVRNIYFPFDIETDTALSVAMEMVAELDITDHEVTRIAEMIDGEVASLVPEWRTGPGIVETPRFPATAFCQNCASNVSSCGSLLDFFQMKSLGNIQIHCSDLECAAMHGRFEEITYQVESSEHCITEGAPVLSTSQSDGLDSCSQESRGSHSGEDGKGDQLLNQAAGDERVIHINGLLETNAQTSLSDLYSNPNLQQNIGSKSPPNVSDDYENEIRQQLRWLKAKYQMERREYKDQQLGGGSRRILHPTPDISNRECRPESRETDISMFHQQLRSLDVKLTKSFHLGGHFPFSIPHEDTSQAPVSHPGSVAPRVRHCEVSAESSPESIFTAKSFYTGGALLPSSLARTKSLPVDAVDV